MTRKCSHCGHNGHNSRTCPDRGVRLFGVRLTDGVSSMNMRKSVSMNNLSHYASAHNSPLSPPEHSESGAAPDGYVSDGLVQTSNNARERKKGVPWTEDEHRLFLIGLQKLGKGDWRGISRNFVQTRTPTQVASHAQKYFIRQSNMNKRKRRSSLFDIVSESGVSSIAEDSVSPSVPELATTPIHQLSLGRMYPMFYETSQLQGYGLPGRPFAVPSQMSPPMALPLMSVGNAGPVTPDQVTEVAGLGYNRESLSRSGSRKSIPIPVPAPPPGPSLSLGGSLGTSQVPYSFNSWPGVTHTGFNMPVSSSPPTSNVVRPTAKVAIAAPSVVKTEGEEDMKDIAQLSLGLSPPEPSQLTLKLLDQPSRHSSAFHRKLRAQIVFAKTPKGRIISSYFCKEMLYAKEASELYVTVRAQSSRKPGI